MEGFTADETSRLTGCTAHQLRYWDRIALVRPNVQATGGRPGVRRLYSFRDIVALRVVQSLLAGGMSLQKVRKAFDYLRKKAELDSELTNVSLATDGRSIFEITGDEGVLMDALKQGQLAFFSAMEEVTARVDGKAPASLYDREFSVAVRKRAELLRTEGDPQLERRLQATR
jgi:DNA-binding transcriptional MerR regulator